MQNKRMRIVLVLSCLVQGVWVPAGRVAACPLPKPPHYAVCLKHGGTSCTLYTVAPASTPGDVTATLPLTVTVWDRANFEILAGQAP